jgi:hypothetical protein
MGTPNLGDLQSYYKKQFVAMFDCFVNVGLLQVLHFDPYYNEIQSFEYHISQVLRIILLFHKLMQINQ